MSHPCANCLLDYSPSHECPDLPECPDGYDGCLICGRRIGWGTGGYTNCVCLQRYIYKSREKTNRYPTLAERIESLRDFADY